MKVTQNFGRSDEKNIHLHCFTERISTQPIVTTQQPSVTLTTILLPLVKPEYEKLPTIKPVSDSKEKTTTSTTATPSIAETTGTVAYNRTSTQPSTVTPTTDTEIGDKLTTIMKIGKVSSSMHLCFMKLISDSMTYWHREYGRSNYICKYCIADHTIHNI